MLELDHNVGYIFYSDNHACVIQRMIGHRAGTGGSSGYYYVRSTCRSGNVFLPHQMLRAFLSGLFRWFSFEVDNTFVIESTLRASAPVGTKR